MNEYRVIPLRPMLGDVEILFGDPETVGQPFVMRIRELPGTVVPPHSHPVDEHITVVKGTWYFGLGGKGYASGTLIQYEIEESNGSRFMAHEHQLRAQ